MWVLEITGFQEDPLVLPPLEIEWGTLTPVPVNLKVSVQVVLPLRVPTTITILISKKNSNYIKHS